MGNRPGTIERARNDARKQRDAAKNERNVAQQNYNKTVQTETTKDNNNIAQNRNKTKIDAELKAAEQWERTKLEVKNLMIDTRDKLSTGFSTHFQRKNNKFDEQVESLKNTFIVVFSKTKDEMDNLMLDVSNQNFQMELQINENKANEDRSKLVKSNFLKKETYNLLYQNKILWYVFYLLLLVLCFVMFFYSPWSRTHQFILFYILLIYPFVIYYIEFVLYILYSYSYSFFTSTKFQQVYLGKY